MFLQCCPLFQLGLEPQVWVLREVMGSAPPCKAAERIQRGMHITPKGGGAERTP